MPDVHPIPHFGVSVGACCATLAARNTACNDLSAGRGSFCEALIEGNSNLSGPLGYGVGA